MAALILISLSTRSVLAQTPSTWNGTTGNWTTASLWNPAVPQNGVPSGTTYNALVSGGGTITLNTAITIEQLTFQSGTITGLNSLTMNALSTVTGGTFSEAGGTFLNGGASVSGVTVSGRTVTLGGAASTLAGNVTLQSGGVLANAAGSTLTASTAGTLTVSFNGGAAAAVTNAGTLVKQGAGTLTLNPVVAFTNTGSVDVQAGVLALSGGGTSTGTVNVGTGATLSGSLTSNAGGQAQGTGTIGGPLTFNTGSHLAPGTNGTGVLTVAAVTMTMGSAFDVQLNGTTFGSGYDRLVATGAVSLGGATLNAVFGFTPAGTDRFAILQSAGVINGTFRDATGSTLAEGAQGLFGDYFAMITYHGNASTLALTGGNDVILYNLQAAPEPGHILLLSAAALGGIGWVRRRVRG